MLTYLGIFIAKVVEVSFTTLRTVMISKGKRKEAACFSIIENIIWLLVVTNVINTIKDDPLKMVFYVTGYATGIMLGSYIEDQLAIGEISITCIVDELEEKELLESLRNKDIPVTVIDGQGLKSKKKILFIISNRKNKNKIIKHIKDIVPHATIATSDTSPIKAYGVK